MNEHDPSRSHHHICLTPTRNEAWIIKRFLAAAKTWASHVVVADQGSTDGTLQELETTSGVTAVKNESATFDEVHRQRLLLNTARKVPGKRILIALDADEALSSNCITSRDWARIHAAASGTMLRFRWVNILPGFKNAWIPLQPRAFGLVDDGADHSGQRIHNPRLPWRSDAPVLDLEDIVVLHFQYVAWERMASKQRWYQAWEHLNHPDKGPLQIFRQYHHMDGSWTKEEIQPLNPEWLADYERAGINFSSLVSEPITWWDRDVCQMLIQHGREHFRKIAIWDKDWNALADQIGERTADIADPRSNGEKIAHRLLKVTQKHRANWGVRGLEHVLRKLGW